MGAPGCDDAPLIAVSVGSKAKDFTLVMPYYENPRFMARQIENWATYPQNLKDHFSVILVDDGSPTKPAGPLLDVLRDQIVGYFLDLYRIDVDVRWNWLAARNIGAHYAKTEWIMLTDMDHVLTEPVLRVLVYGRHDPSIIYRFSRREHTGEARHPHPNSWFMTKQMYWQIGGYDEALSGHYGTDSEYRRRCAATAPIRIMTDALVRYEFFEDSSTTRYKRKQPEDLRAKEMIRRRKPDWKPKVLSFPYREVVW